MQYTLTEEEYRKLQHRAKPLAEETLSIFLAELNRQIHIRLVPLEKPGSFFSPINAVPAISLREAIEIAHKQALRHIAGLTNSPEGFNPDVYTTV